MPRRVGRLDLEEARFHLRIRCAAERAFYNLSSSASILSCSGAPLSAFLLSGSEPANASVRCLAVHLNDYCC
jgi:hypothetical protein